MASMGEKTAALEQSEGTGHFHSRAVGKPLSSETYQLVILKVKLQATQMFSQVTLSCLLLGFLLTGVLFTSKHLIRVTHGAETVLGSRKIPF